MNIKDNALDKSTNPEAALQENGGPGFIGASVEQELEYQGVEPGESIDGLVKANRDAVEVHESREEIAQDSSEIASAEDVALIQELDGRICSRDEDNLADAQKIGGICERAKRRCGHGNFLPWLKGTVRIPKRRAQRYMEVFRERDFLKSEGVTHLTEAYRAIARKKREEEKLPQAVRKLDESPAGEGPSGPDPVSVLEECEARIAGVIPQIEEWDVPVATSLKLILGSLSDNVRHLKDAQTQALAS